MPVLFFLLWIIFNGKITLEIVLFGIAITGIVGAFAYKVVGYPVSADIQVLRNMHWFVLYILDLIWEIIKAAVSVMGLIFHAEDPDPVIIEFHSGFDSRLKNVLLANSITLTPGTITVFQEGDHFVVHCLRPEYAEGMEESTFIRLLRRVK